MILSSLRTLHCEPGSKPCLHNPKTIFQLHVESKNAASEKQAHVAAHVSNETAEVIDVVLLLLIIRSAHDPKAEVQVTGRHRALFGGKRSDVNSLRYFSVRLRNFMTKIVGKSTGYLKVSLQSVTSSRFMASVTILPVFIKCSACNCMYSVSSQDLTGSDT